MTKYVINQFHFHGNYYAGDHIDIHDNTSVHLYQGEYSKQTTAHETCVEDIPPCPSSVTSEFDSDISPFPSSVTSEFNSDISPFPSSVTSEFNSDIPPCPSSVTSEFNSDISDSIIFTKKARKENKIPTIIHALQKSIIGRRDKTRAFVQELQSWQNDGYVDAHYNARVMYDELNKITPLTFGYEVFKKYYNNTI